MKIVSLFSNIGIAETYLEEIGFQVVLANEICKRRMKLYSDFYPETLIKNGDFADQTFFNEMVKETKRLKPDIILATPPCQGMSTAGPLKSSDSRNNLTLDLVNYIKIISPKYIFLENVPLFMKTEVLHNGNKKLLKDILYSELKERYHLESRIINMKDFSVPQSRSRVIFLLTRRDIKKIWKFPEKDKNTLTLRDAIGKLPELDPYIKDISDEENLIIFPDFYKKKEQALKVSKWHKPPSHIKRQVLAMMKTPSGKSAFNNSKHKPINQDGELIKGYGNTYKRQNWDMPAYTITMDNVKISSQDNVHPGRFKGTNELGENIYSDARVFSLFELMRLTTLPDDWSIPKGASEAFIRRLIGEGIPPLFVKKIFGNIIK